eukprot:CAMPEP_0118872570 /NCGR_PEP_ID=MMETSP1163-20130328/14680_1 /TAXON_ID=124430 /ORGANISM="Phaeomonas parva, Strain CCMP2877" /LENGTH=304 /DNA_ID=CAMNT_0006807771 /DNA_START=170 /DNA_END=1084 /DNA_ORIENTATION=+
MRGGDDGRNKTRGFVGIGIMGAGMARNLLEGGYDLVVWNRSPGRVEQLAADYPGRVTVAGSAREVCESADVTFSMLSTPEAAAAVFDGPDGVLAGLGRGKTLVDCATLEEADMQRMALAAEGAGATFVEAPVSGSKGPAETGTLVFLAGGDEAAYEAIAPELDLMGKAKYYLGGVGKGTRMKLVVNMVMGSMMASLGEGLALAERAGLDPKEVVSVLGQGAMANPMFALKGPKVARPAGERDHAPNFPLKHAQKDVRFALNLAAKEGVELPVAAAANALMMEAMEEYGLGDEDFSAVVESVMER